MFSSVVIGLGQIGLMYDFEEKRVHPSSHCLAYETNSHINLVAAADVNVTRESDLHRIAAKTRFYNNYLEMLNENSQVDIVSICTPPINRFNELREIIEISRARIIFCEKPLALNIEEAEHILKLVQTYNGIIVPNISRRWIPEFIQIRDFIRSNQYGSLQKIHARYTRGIYNSGTHLFDLIRWLTSDITEVFTANQVLTSADKDNDPSYSFLFKLQDGQTGYAEAFDDRHYYFFEIDLYFERGKIEIKQSGNQIFYYVNRAHSLFTGFQELYIEKEFGQILTQSALKLAIENLISVLNEKDTPFCKLEDACIPLYVGRAIERSFQSKTWQKVEVTI
ncbi:Gfo/Idh/MocA family protein [Paenibacillus andongensis]|uniref:Gfo/Idh/MocA family protein n=1 Tax=Paenibacillus andongensis TaxID=2975482 RepID=UPI0021BA9048|nr:Gfo/Idh/MocA family oxidoreductase [Paenibacillus andongensis]